MKILKTRQSILEDFATGISDKDIDALPELKALLEERQQLRDHISLLHLFLAGVDAPSLERCIDAGITLRRIAESGVIVQRRPEEIWITGARYLPLILLKIRNER